MSDLSQNTPSVEIIKAAVSEIECIDSTGRVIKLRKPGVLAQYRLVEALGETASNETYMGMALPLIYVAAIDGDMISPLSSKVNVEALISRLDEPGIEAVMMAVRDNFGGSNPEADKESLKK